MKPWRRRRRGTKRHRRRRGTKRRRIIREKKRHRRIRRTKPHRRRWCTPEKQGRLLHLPDEILLLIFDVLDYTTAIILTRVHPRFWNLVNPATFYSQQRKSADIEHAQDSFARFKGRLACHGCFRVLSADRFADPGVHASLDSLREFLGWFWEQTEEHPQQIPKQGSGRRCYDCFFAEEEQNPPASFVRIADRLPEIQVWVFFS